MRDLSDDLYEQGKHAPHVYFMQFGSADAPVKIGYTRNLGARLRTIESSHWEPMVLLVAIPGDKSKETEIHAKLSRFRIGTTEWFESSDELRTFVDEIRSAQLTEPLRKSVELSRGKAIEDLYARTMCATCGRPIRVAQPVSTGSSATHGTPVTGTVGPGGYSPHKGGG